MLSSLLFSQIVFSHTPKARPHPRPQQGTQQATTATPQQPAAPQATATVISQAPMVPQVPVATGKTNEQLQREILEMQHRQVMIQTQQIEQAARTVPKAQVQPRQDPLAEARARQEKMETLARKHAAFNNQLTSAPPGTRLTSLGHITGPRSANLGEMALLCQTYGMRWPLHITPAPTDWQY